MSLRSLAAPRDAVGLGAETQGDSRPCRSDLVPKKCDAALKYLSHMQGVSQNLVFSKIVFEANINL